MNLFEPFGTQLDLTNGHIDPTDKIIQRHLSDMSKMYADEAAANEIISKGDNRLIYEVNAVDLPEEEGHLLYCTTIIHPGCIGNEYHMTKGHFHEIRGRAEVYTGLSGEGYLLLQTDDGEVRTVPMTSGTIAYVPPMWAHRTINTGTEKFVFLAIWSGDAGHDYGTIEQEGFAKCLVDKNGKPTLVDNPRHKEDNT
jgi:glucose-6-phosphate isomerase, archaeal